jgi:hypothetical protein
MQQACEAFCLDVVAKTVRADAVPVYNMSRTQALIIERMPVDELSVHTS